MSYLSEELERQMAAADGGKGYSVDDLVVPTRMSRGQIYRWKAGDQTSISPEQLTLLALALSDDPLQHAALVRAHLLDEKFGPHHELVRVEIDAHALHEKPRVLSEREAAIGFLAELSIKSRSTADLLIQQARALGAQFAKKPSSAVQAVAEGVVADAVAAARAERAKPPGVAGRVRYKVPRHPKK